MRAGADGSQRHISGRAAARQSGPATIPEKVAGICVELYVSRFSIKKSIKARIFAGICERVGR